MAKDENEVVKSCLRVVSSEIDGILRPSGFERLVPEEEREGYRFKVWRLDLGWKQASVRMGWDKPPQTSHILLSLGVWLPCPEGGETWVDGADVSSLAGKPGGYPLPSFFGKVTTRGCWKLGRRIAQDVTHAIPWLKKYSSPDECLRRLRSGETQRGMARGESYQILSAYLEGLIGARG